MRVGLGLGLGIGVTVPLSLSLTLALAGVDQPMSSSSRPLTMPLTAACAGKAASRRKVCLHALQKLAPSRPTKT